VRNCQSLLWSLCLMFCSISASAQMQFDNNEKCIAIYNNISALKLQDASVQLMQEVRRNPGNGMLVLYANYIDFYELFFNEDPAEYTKRKANQSTRLSLFDKANENSPFFLHNKAMIYLQWAMVKLKFNHYIDAAKDMRKAYQLFAENKKKYPSSTMDDAYFGSIQSAIGTIPGNYQWVASLLGLKGNLKTGAQLVENAMASNTNPFAADALFFYVYIKQYLQNEPKQAWNALKKYRSKCADNRLLTFMTANIAINQNKADEVIKVIDENANQKGFIALPILDYEMGSAYLFKINHQCIGYFKKFLANSKGTFYKKDAYYKMAMMSYLEGKQADANYYAAKINAQEGSDADADKTAQNFSKSLQWPNKDLLKIRFLFDGGYFAKALQLANASPTNVQTIVEHSYRKARIFDEQKQDDSAIVYYTKTIDLGKQETTYFAARAALQLAVVHEDKKNYKMAATYFAQSMKMKNKEYKNSIDMRAKAGLQRVSK
jgi:hypothetical protein